MASTILMIHGYGCAGGCWDTAAKRLRAEGYRVETPTLRADQRRTDTPGAGLAVLSLADYVADMSALAASLAKETGQAPIVFGHSMGGMIAQKLAEAGLVSGVVLFAPASPADARGKPKLSPVFTFLNAILTPNAATKAVKMWKTGFKWGVLNATPVARHDALYATAVYDSGRVLADLAWPDKDPNRTAHVDVDKVKVPLLVVAGALDRTTPVDDLRLVGQKYSAVGGDYVEYPNNAHWLIDEPGTDVILSDVTGWLRNKDLGAVIAKPAAKAAATAKTPPPEKTKAEAPVKAAAPPSAKKTPAKPKAPARAAPAAKAPAKAAPAKTAKTVKPAEVVAPAPAKAPKPKTVAPKAATKAKPAATTSTAKSSPKSKKSV